MTDQQNQELDPVSESWDRNIKLRNDLASRAGKPDNLEIRPLDAPKQLMGSAVSSVGTGVKELSLGDVVRAGENVQKGSMLGEGINWLAGKAADTFLSPENAAQAKMATAAATGLADGANINGSSKGTNKAINTVADTADVVIKPVAQAVGGTIKDGGDWIKNTVSDQGKEAMNRQFFTEDKDGSLHAGDAWTTDPAVWAMKMSDVIGTVGGALVVGGAVKGGVKAAVTRSMLKRGAPEAYAAQVAELTAQRIGEKAALSTGAAMSVGQTADQTRESVKSLSFEELMNSDSFKQNVQLVNQDPQYQSLSSSDRLDLARQRTADMAADYAKSDPTTYAAAAAGTVLGDAMLFKMITGKAGASEVTGNILSRAGKGFIKGGVGESVGEAVEEGAQKNIQNRSDNAIAGTHIDPMQGVAQSAAEAGVLGFMSGGGIGAGSSVVHGSNNATKTDEASDHGGSQSVDQQDIVDSNAVNDINNKQPTDDSLNIPAYQRQGEISPELQAATQQAQADAQQFNKSLAAEENGVLAPIEKTVTGNPDEPAFLRTQQNNPTGRDTSTLQDADPYTQAQAALAKGGAPTADNLIQQSIKNWNQGKTPQEAGLTGDLLLAKQQPGVPATTEQGSGATIDGQADEVIPESRGLGYNNQINMPGQPGNGINDNYVPPVTQSRQTADKSLDTESTHDPRSPVAKSIDNAGQQADAIFDQLKTVRVTKKGKPFGSQKEAQLASRKTETPIELPTGGFGVVDKAELEQVQSEIQTDRNQTPSDVTDTESKTTRKNGDVRGMGFAVVSKDGRVITSGSIPSLIDPESELSSVDYYKNIADKHGGDLYLGGINKLESEHNEPLIFGKTWSEIQDLQSGKGSRQVNKPKGNLPENHKLVYQSKTADQAERTPSPDTVTPPVMATDSQPRAAPSIDDEITEAIVEHTTGKGKVLRGVVRTGLTVAQAKAIDPYTFKKDGGHFIREQHLDKLSGVKAETSITAEPEAENDATFTPRDGWETNLQAAREYANHLRKAGKISEQDALKAWNSTESLAKLIKQIEVVQTPVVGHGDDAITLDQLKQLRVDIINKINQQEADNRSVDDRLMRKKGQLDKAIDESEQAAKKEQRPNFADMPEINNAETESLAQELGLMVADGKTMEATKKLKSWQAERDPKGKMANWEQQAIIDRAKTIADNIKSQPKRGGDPQPDPEPTKDRFADNKLFTADRVAAARARMKSKIGNLNSGLDPEMLVDGMTIAGAYIESGVRNFTTYTKAMTDDFGDGIKPFLLSFWEGARNYPGLDTKGMTSVEDSAKQHAELASNKPAQASKADTPPTEQPVNRDRQILRDSLHEKLGAGESINNNNDLKRIAAELLGVKTSDLSTMQLKEAQEAYEAAAVRHRRDAIVDVLSRGNGVHEAFQSAVEAYEGQPNLDVRTAKSSDLQAYSTPTPMALLANLAAGAWAGKTVFEPTAGNGLLLLTADAKTTYSNELDPDRADSLAWSGFNVTIKDATNNPLEGMVPEKFDLEAGSLREDIKVTSAQAFQWLSDTNDRTSASLGLRTREGDVVLRRLFNGGYEIEMPKAVSKGKRYWGDPSMVKLIGEHAVKGNGKLNVRLTNEQAKGVVSVMERINPLTITNQAQIADFNRMTGKSVPTFSEKGMKFSKVKMTAAEQAGKGMTKPEATLAAKEWLKQFKTDVQVKVAKDQAEFDQLMTEAGQGGTLNADEIANAAYLPESKTLLLNASAIQNPARLRQLMRHEILGHHGLEYVIGKGAVNDILQILKNGYATSKAIRDAVDTVAANYADADVKTKIKEAFAHYAENRPVDQGPLGRLWDRVVSAVKSALVKAGFIRANEAEKQLDSILKTIAENMRQGRSDNGPNGGTGNKAYFSKGNNGDTSAYGQAGSLLKESGSSLVNWLKQQRGRGLGTLTDLQIDQIYRDVTGGAVSRYQKLRTKMESDRNDILLEAETKYEPMWEAMPKAEKAALSNLMHDATMARIHPDIPLEENTLYQEAKKNFDNAKKPETKAAYQAELDVIENNYRQLSERYRLSSKQSKELYATMRDLYAKQWDKLRDAITKRIEDQMGEGGKALASKMRLRMEHALQHGPYFPLARFGDYVVKARKGDEYIREHFEKRKDAEAALKQYRGEGYDAVMTVKETRAGDQANAHALGMEVMELLDKAGETGANPEGLKDAVWQAMLDMLPDASYAKHAIHRKRIKGASRDGHRAYLQSVYHYAHHISKIRYGHQMKAELDGMKEQVQAAMKGEESPIKTDDVEIAQQVLNEMNLRHEMNMNPKGSALAGQLGNLGFLFYLGASPASAMVNLTQNVTVMLPQLAGKYGFVKASKFMLKAMSDYLRHGVFKQGTKEAWVSLTRATDKAITADERAMLNSLYKAGVLDLTQAHSIAARADTDQQNVKPGKQWARTGMRWAGALFHNAEVLNREVAALTAYRLMKEQQPGIASAVLKGDSSAIDQVAEMVYDGHGNYAASNRPRYMRGDVMKVLTQFKIYSQMMTYTLARNAAQAAKGDKAALKTLGAMFGTTWMMAGMMGMPTPVGLIMYGLASLFDDDDDRSGEASFRLGLTEVFGADVGELIAKGPVDAVTGLNISGRTGLSDLWWRSPKEGVEGDDLTFHYVQQIAGPVLGIGVSAVRGMREFANGDVQRGVEAMAPKAVKDLAKAYRQASEGEQTRNGDSVINDVDAWHVASQAMGFSSADMAKIYSAREYIKGKEKIIEERRANLLADYFAALQSRDSGEMQDVMDNIREFNASHNKAEAITGKTLKQSIKSRERSGERTQAGTYLSSKREYLRSEGAFLSSLD